MKFDNSEVSLEEMITQRDAISKELYQLLSLPKELKEENELRIRKLQRNCHYFNQKIEKIQERQKNKEMTL